MKRYILFTTLLTLLLMQGCSQAPAEVEAPIRPVKTFTVGATNQGKQWTFSGTAEDALATDLSFRVGGKIVAFPGDQIGRKFAKGDVIANLDPSDYELEYSQAKASMEQVRANYTRAKADLQRNSQLFERYVISLGELDQIHADVKSYEAHRGASSKQLDIARKRMGYTTLRAPFDGWIGRVETNIHQNVNSGEGVVSFNAGQQMKMYIAIPDVLISQVTEGDEVEVRFDALPGRTTTGEVTEVSIDSTSGSTYPVKIYLQNADKLVRSGMSGHVNFLGQTNGKASYSLPSEAIIGKADGTRTIWLIDPETSTVRSQPVTVGQLSVHGIRIVDGVKPGDIVVTRGVHKLKEGLKVRYNANEAKG